METLRLCTHNFKAVKTACTHCTTEVREYALGTNPQQDYGHHLNCHRITMNTAGSRNVHDRAGQQ